MDATYRLLNVAKNRFDHKSTESRVFLGGLQSCVECLRRDFVEYPPPQAETRRMVSRVWDGLVDLRPTKLRPRRSETHQTIWSVLGGLMGCHMHRMVFLVLCGGPWHLFILLSHGVGGES